MDPLRVRRGGAQGAAEGTGHLAQLRVQVLPLAYPQVVEVLGAAQLAKLVGGQGFLLFGQVPPQVEVGQEVRLLVAEPGVRLARLLLPVRRPLARVLDGQRGRDHEYLAQRSVVDRGQDHPGDPRVDRQLGELLPERGQLSGGVQRAQLDQQVHPVTDGAPVRRVEEREVGHLAQPQRGHLEDHRGEVGPQDLRVGVRRAALEVGLVVQPDADAVGDPAAPAGPLVGRGPGDRLDGQPLHLEPVAVPGDPGGTGIHHVPDPGDGQRGLRDVGGQHDPAAGMGGEDPVLLGHGQPGEQRQDLGVRPQPAP